MSFVESVMQQREQKIRNKADKLLNKIKDNLKTKLGREGIENNPTCDYYIIDKDRLSNQKENYKIFYRGLHYSYVWFEGIFSDPSKYSNNTSEIFGKYICDLRVDLGDIEGFENYEIFILPNYGFDVDKYKIVYGGYERYNIIISKCIKKTNYGNKCAIL